MSLHHALLKTSAHPDIHAYIYFATEVNPDDNLVRSLYHFMKTGSLSQFPQYASPLETEIWNNGVKRLVQDPTGQPYAANPDETVKRILERVYERNYLYYVEPTKNRD